MQVGSWQELWGGGICVRLGLRGILSPSLRPLEADRVRPEPAPNTSTAPPNVPES